MLRKSAALFVPLTALVFAACHGQNEPVPAAPPPPPSPAPVAAPAPSPPPRPAPPPPPLAIAPVDTAPPEFVALSGGRFHLGCEPQDNDCRDLEKPGSDENIAPFKLMRTEVTVGEYGACVAAGKCTAAKVTSGRSTITACPPAATRSPATPPGSSSVTATPGKRESVEEAPHVPGVPPPPHHSAPVQGTAQRTPLPPLEPPLLEDDALDDEALELEALDDEALELEALDDDAPELEALDDDALTPLEVPPLLPLEAADEETVPEADDEVDAPLADDDALEPALPELDAAPVVLPEPEVALEPEHAQSPPRHSNTSRRRITMATSGRSRGS